MPKQRSEKGNDAAAPAGPSRTAPEPTAPEMVTLIHPRTGEELPTVARVAEYLVAQGWQEKERQADKST